MSTWVLILKSAVWLPCSRLQASGASRHKTTYFKLYDTLLLHGTPATVVSLMSDAVLYRRMPQHRKLLKYVAVGRDDIHNEMKEQCYVHGHMNGEALFGDFPAIVQGQQWDVIRQTFMGSTGLSSEAV